MANNDLIAFEEFYRKFYPSLIAFGRYLLHSEDDAKEVVNDVFLNVWDKRDVLILDESLKSYLFQSVKNRSVNLLKQRKKSLMQIEDPDLIEIPAEVLNKIEDKDNQERLEILMGQLPPKCRQVFSMSRFDRLSNKEIAEMMDISIKTVENQMTKALKFFRKNLNLE